MFSKETLELMCKISANEVAEGRFVSWFISVLAVVDKIMGTEDMTKASMPAIAVAKAAGYTFGFCMRPVVYALNIRNVVRMGAEAARVGEEFWYRIHSVELR